MQFDYDMSLADKLLNQYLADNPDISVESIAYSGVFCSDMSELSDEDASLPLSDEEASLPLSDEDASLPLSSPGFSGLGASPVAPSVVNTM